jgi:alpha-beta hydrolase superfamily lysophospholipase
MPLTLESIEITDLSAEQRVIGRDASNAADARRADSDPRTPAQPIYFAASDHELFGWLYEPKSDTSYDIGLVICKPFGYEAMCAHRSMRALAELMASMGIPTLLFDYLGTGDSPDIDPYANQLDVWSADVAAAARELQNRTGVTRVCLLGIRLGALLATLAARYCTDVSGLILIAPIVAGRRYLRELRTTRLAAALGSDRKEPVPGAGDVDSADAQPMEVSGFSLSPSTVQTLRQTDLKDYTPPVKDVLILDSQTLPTARAWVALLSAAGARTDYHAIPGIVEMLMTDPQFAVLAEAIPPAMSDWLPRLNAQSTARDPTRARVERQPGSGPVALQLSREGSALSGGLWERPVFLRSGALLFGIVTEPSKDNKRRRCVILLNVGAEHHIGSNRMYVALSRKWAAHGYTVLRLDLAGLGDSETRAGRPDSDVFPSGALDDIRVAVDFMRKQYGSCDITLAGICSGAYHSLRAAIAGMAVNRILLVNPMNFLWGEGLSAPNLQLNIDVNRNLGFYRERLFSLDIWKRILTGRLNPWRIVRIAVGRPLLNLMSILGNVARTMKIRLPGDLGWELLQVKDRGVRMIFVFARGEPGLDVLRLQAGSAIKRLGEHCAIHVIDSADHIFSHGSTREALEQILSRELFSRLPQGAVSH